MLSASSLAVAFSIAIGLGGACNLGAGAIHFTQTSSLAFEATEIEQLGAAHLVGTHYLNFIQDRGIQGEDTLYALAKADLANSEAALGTVALCNHRAFKGLNAFF